MLVLKTRGVYSDSNNLKNALVRDEFEIKIISIIKNSFINKNLLEIQLVERVWTNGINFCTNKISIIESRGLTKRDVKKKHLVF